MAQSGTIVHYPYVICHICNMVIRYFIPHECNKKADKVQQENEMNVKNDLYDDQEFPNKKQKLENSSR